LRWSGTFHGIGARLLREYAKRIGLQESFSILDRSDAEDLLALVRHDLGLSDTKSRFPTKATCVAIYSRVVNSGATLREVLERTFPWCAAWEPELKKVSPRTSAPSKPRTCSTTTTCSCIGRKC